MAAPGTAPVPAAPGATAWLAGQARCLPSGAVRRRTYVKSPADSLLLRNRHSWEVSSKGENGATRCKRGLFERGVREAGLYSRPHPRTPGLWAGRNGKNGATFLRYCAKVIGPVLGVKLHFPGPGLRCVGECKFQFSDDVVLWGVLRACLENR
jgi:hypothetical protein